MPFNPRSHPYITYLNGSHGSNFKRDNAVRLATDYYENGIIPPSFLWLNGGLLPSLIPTNEAIGGAGAMAAAAALGSIPIESNHSQPANKKSRGGHQGMDSLSTGSKRGSGGGSRAHHGESVQSGSTSKKARRDNTNGIAGQTGDGKNRKVR
ncbi:hypothetical protein BDR26DRAFT_260110 [Obelidium mucronatum]|nr:hypothetical protein BDR26DRAFT_260110 [Obelidium mucronatum]